MNGFRFDLQLFTEHTIQPDGSYTIGNVTYTNASTSDTAIIAEEADATPELTSGIVTFSAVNASLVAKGIEVTNTSGGVLTVDATGTNAVITTASGGICSVKLGVGKSASINGRLYTNASETVPATISTTADSSKFALSTGAVTIDSTAIIVAEGVVTLNGNVSVIAKGVTATNIGNLSLTVDAKGTSAKLSGNCSAVIGAGKMATINGVTYTNTSDSAQLTVAAANGGTAVTVAAGGSATIDGVAYTNAGQGDATITKAKGETAVLTNGAVVMPQNEALTVADSSGAKRSTLNQPPFGSFRHHHGQQHPHHQRGEGHPFRQH